MLLAAHALLTNASERRGETPKPHPHNHKRAPPNPLHGGTVPLRTLRLPMLQQQRLRLFQTRLTARTRRPGHFQPARPSRRPRSLPARPPALLRRVLADPLPEMCQR